MLKNMQEVLEYGYDVLNNFYFGGELPPVVISIMSSPRTNGHFTLGKVWRKEDVHLHEINISAEHIDRPIENIMATMCHEMVHFHCLLHGIKDVSQNGRYHNRNFKREAEARGLLIEYAEYIGYSVTTPGEEFVRLIADYGIVKPADINRDGEKRVMVGIGGADGSNNVGGTENKPRCSTRKYQCPLCLNSFRATKDINVLCMDCNVQFVKIEK